MPVLYLIHIESIKITTTTKSIQKKKNSLLLSGVSSECCIYVLNIVGEIIFIYLAS